MYGLAHVKSREVTGLTKFCGIRSAHRPAHSPIPVLEAYTYTGIDTGTTLLTRRNRLQGLGLVDPVSVVLMTEYEYCVFSNNLDIFQRMWCVDGTVCGLMGTKVVIWLG